MFIKNNLKKIKWKQRRFEYIIPGISVFGLNVAEGTAENLS